MTMTPDERFGGCPSCGSSDGYFNVRASHFFFCNAHKTVWNPAFNVFSGWQDESEADWDRNKEQFADYNLVEPVYPEAA